MFEMLKNLFDNEKKIAPDVEQRATDVEQRATEGETLSSILSGDIFKTSDISKENAMNIPAVATSIEFISATIAGLPVKLYRKSDGAIIEVEDDYRLKLLNSETGDLLDAVQFKKALIKDMLLDGAGYAYIDKKGNQIDGLYYVDSRYVSVLESTDKIHKSVKIYLNGVEYRDFEVFRITRATKNGVTGMGLLQTNPVLLNAMYNALKYENTAVSSGTKRGFLKSKYKLEPSMLDDLKKSWQKLYSTDITSRPDVMVLNEGITFEAANSTATENQLNESKKVNSSLIYQLFGLSDGLFDTTSGSHDCYLNNIKTGVLPVVEALNNAINKFLLLEREKDSLFFVVDVSEIMKANISERYAAYNTALAGGWLMVDEIRKAENMAPLGLDFVKMSLGNVLYYPKSGKIYTPNTGQTSGDGIESNSTENLPNGENQRE